MEDECGLCECDKFVSNPDVTAKCIECDHDHSKSLEDLPIWEREAVETNLRAYKEARKDAERVRLRKVAEASHCEKEIHKGNFVKWHKLVGDEQGFKTVAMGSLWFCCLAQDKDAPCCGKGELSDLHEPCIRCGLYFLPFELPKACRFHTGKLVLKDVTGKKYRWSCCDRLNNEEGCTSNFEHRV
eukprot:m.95748 g.95748  ORF g.95748 m.95748 type:complete len:185 (-) comp13513_c0_seq2:31-585(-)